jgi:hypothetical protein
LSSLDAVAAREAVGNGLVRFSEKVDGKMRMAGIGATLIAAFPADDADLCMEAV